MSQYETAFLISPNLEEEETSKIISQMLNIVSKKKGKMIKEDRWGKRKLAYPINKFEEAFYVFFHYEGEPDIPFELERRFKQSEAILRFLTVRKEKKENVRKKKKGIPEPEKTAPKPEETAALKEEVIKTEESGQKDMPSPETKEEEK